MLLPDLPYKRLSCSLPSTLPTPSSPSLPLSPLPPHAVALFASLLHPRRDLGTHRPPSRPLRPSRPSRTPHFPPLLLQVCSPHPLFPPFKRPLRKNIPRHVRRGCCPPQDRPSCSQIALPRFSTQNLLYRTPTHTSWRHIYPRHRGRSPYCPFPRDGERWEKPRAARVGEHLCLCQ